MQVVDVFDATWQCRGDPVGIERGDIWNGLLQKAVSRECDENMNNVCRS